MITKGLLIVLLTLFAAIPASKGQDIGSRDSLDLAPRVRILPPPDSFGIVLRIFSDDTLQIVTAVIGYNSPNVTATSASKGPLIRDIEESAFMFSNYPSKQSFALTWVGIGQGITAPKGETFATVYFKMLRDFTCSSYLEYDTCTIRPALQTSFTPMNRMPFAPQFEPLVIYCIDVEDVYDQFDTTQQIVTAFPNPFNSGTTFELDMPSSEHLTITIYDILGRHVRTIVDDLVTRGLHQFAWDGNNESGKSASSGVYLARITSRSDSTVRKLVLLR